MILRQGRLRLGLCPAYLRIWGEKYICHDSIVNIMAGVDIVLDSSLIQWMSGLGGAQGPESSGNG